MMLNMYSVFDNKVGVWNRPFFARFDDEAIRVFAFNGRSDKFMSENAADYDLFYIGEFNDAMGTFVAEKHINLGNLSSFIRKEEANA